VVAVHALGEPTVRLELGTSSLGAGVIDPLLWTGFPLTLLGLVRLLDLLKRSWGKRKFSGGLGGYAYHTLCELDATERLVGALYAP
jgi:FADH2 O2-dependent halogenase